MSATIPTTESQLALLSDLIDRADDALTAWAIQWLGLDLAALWPDLDDDQRDALVSAGVVSEVDPTVKCTDADSWRSEWLSENGAAWPCYWVDVSADGLDPVQVTGWHCVGFFGPDACRRSEEWDSEDGDGQFSGRPTVDGRTYRGGDNVDDSARPIPCWRHEGRWVTISPDALDDAFRAAARTADHGAPPSWEDVTEDDRDKHDDETYYLVLGGEVTEETLWHGGIAPRAVESKRHYGHRNTEYGAEAWGWRGGDETYETADGARAAMADTADDGKVYTDEAEAEQALARIAEGERGPDLPAGLSLEWTAGVLHVVSEDADCDPYPLDAGDMADVLRYGWAGVLRREGFIAGDEPGVFGRRYERVYVPTPGYGVPVSVSSVGVTGFGRSVGTWGRADLAGMVAAVLDSAGDDHTRALVLADAVQEAGEEGMATAIRSAVAAQQAKEID